MDFINNEFIGKGVEVKKNISINGMLKTFASMFFLNFAVGKIEGGIVWFEETEW